jgi:riboflavin kinase / FMN adenylyltransferase
VTALAVVHSAADWAAAFGGPQQASQRGAVVSIGNFDGMHLGHQKILGAVAERARQLEAVATVITFDPHPLKVLRPAQAPPLVCTLKQRLEGFASMGIEAALVLRFDMNLAARSPEEFVLEFLAGPLRAKSVLVGGNFRFGYRQAGNAAALQELGVRLGFTVEIIEPVVSRGEVVSSTAVRRAVSEGRVSDASRLLGRPFALTGEITRGEGRGSTILVPTLNLAPEQELLPKTGVYATETAIDGCVYRSATNVGFRPTFNGAHLSVESHLFGFDEQLTLGRLEVRFRERLRDEQKFSGPEELRKQIAADMEQARQFFGRLDSEAAQPLRNSGGDQRRQDSQ